MKDKKVERSVVLKQTRGTIIEEALLEKELSTLSVRGSDCYVQIIYKRVKGFFGIYVNKQIGKVYIRDEDSDILVKATHNKYGKEILAFCEYLQTKMDDRVIFVKDYVLHPKVKQKNGNSNI